MLGADEYGFSTAPLIATGCIMMRACHLNTCPVGIATQDPELRKRFEGKPEHVVNFFFFVAEELRGIMASLGIRTMDELIGRSDLLVADEAIDHWKARGVDLTHILHRPELPDGATLRRLEPPPPVLDDALDWSLLEQSAAAIERGEKVSITTPVRNVNRCVGGILSSHIAAARGAEGLPEGTIEVELHGSAGQSFGGWLAPGVTFTLHGDANDYTGKGLSGGVARGHAAGRRDLPRRGERDHRQHRALRRDERARVLPRHRRRALRGAQLGRQRRRRGRRRPRLRVHDRRARRRPRRAPGATSPPA